MWEYSGSRIFIVERDIYARQCIASYLSWDRRTRVVGMAGTVHEMIASLATNPDDGRLDAVLLDTGLASDPASLGGLIKLIHHHVPDAKIICLAVHADTEFAVTARLAGASAYYVRDTVGLGLAGAVEFAIDHWFAVTEELADHAATVPTQLFRDSDVLPSRRRYERLTPRVEQALWLCVVEGLPAELAAEEMGVSTSTVRSYIKEGYRILEAEDSRHYPPTVSPAERAFLRFTALDIPEVLEDEPEKTPWRPAA